MASVHRQNLIKREPMASVHSQNLMKLAILKETLRKLDNDREKTPAMLELRRILLKRIKQMESEIRNQRAK
jgi:hypothetical protein